MPQQPSRDTRYADFLGNRPASDYLTLESLGTEGITVSGIVSADSVIGSFSSDKILGLDDSLTAALGTIATSRLVGAIDADSLDGKLPSYYLDLGNSTGTLSGDRLYGIPYERLLDAPTGGGGTVDAGDVYGNLSNATIDYSNISNTPSGTVTASNVYGNLDNANIPVANVSGSINADAVGGATTSQLRDRSTHTGTQPASSIGDLGSILDTLQPDYALNAGSLGGVAASGYLTTGGTIASSQVPGLDDSILSALGTISTSRLVGAIDADSLNGKLPGYYLALENSTGTLAGDRLYGIPYERLTGAPSGTVAASDVYGSLGNASVPASNITGSVDAASVGGATASQLRDRTTHTGTQPASTIGDLNSILDTIRGGTASDALLLGGNPPSFYQPASGTIAGDRLTGNAPSITIDASQVANLGTVGGGGTQADYALNAGSLGGNPPSFYLRAVAAGTTPDISAARISGTGTNIILPHVNIDHSARPIFSAHNDPADPNTDNFAPLIAGTSGVALTSNIFTVSVDNRNGWNASINGYTIPEKGIYRVSGLLTMISTIDRLFWSCFLFKNGAVFRMLNSSSVSGSHLRFYGNAGSHTEVFQSGDLLQIGYLLSGYNNQPSHDTVTYSEIAGVQLFSIEQLYRMP